MITELAVLAAMGIVVKFTGWLGFWGFLAGYVIGEILTRQFKMRIKS